MDLAPEAAHRRCRNCEAPLHGPYCAACGQEAHGNARTLGTLLHDAWEVLTHVDGRFWGTLRALAFRPGILSAEYLSDRRARYLPPFRLYLVLSILFFAVATAGSGTSEGKVVRLDADPARAAEAKARVEAARRELEASGQKALAGALDAAARPGAGAADRARVCEFLAGTGGERTGRALVSACTRAVADGGQALGHAFVANVPKAMFLFLPIVALVLFVLFGRSRRFYVEHLVVVLHLQSALFLAAAATSAADALAGWAGAPRDVGDVLTLALWVYAGWYAYRALRVAYGEGRAPTLAKLAALGFAYAVLLAVTLAGTALLSAVTA